MANRPAPALLLRDADREELLRLTRSSRAPAGLALRARIVLLAADGVSNTTIADGVGVSRPTVIAWRDRYQAKGIAGLHDEDRSGRPRRIDRAKVIAVTLAPQTWVWAANSDGARAHVGSAFMPAPSPCRGWCRPPRTCP